ncbi:MAG: hypothetical protein ACFCGT_04575 [Sandaracinaceae bacterium]
MTTRRARATALVSALTILAAPAALAFETALRRLLFPPDFVELRALLAPYLTPVAWGLGLGAGLGALLGVVVQRRLSAGRLARLPAGADDDRRHEAVLGVFLLTTAAPQVPAVLGTLLHLFGAALTPVLVGIALSTAGVIAQAARLGRLARSA